MFQPKQFYRDLESLLQEVKGDRYDPAGLRDLLAAIVARFGHALFIGSGRLYIEVEGGFVLEHQVNSLDPSVAGLLITNDYQPLRRVLENGVYLFDGTISEQSEALEGRLGGLESGALVVEGEMRSILAFGLQPGWQREDVDFALHTIRNAINHRISLQRLETDFEQAAEIQRSLLPIKALEFPGFEVAARSVAAAKVGGDFYDFLALSTDSLAIAIGDASGHGLGAALVARDVVTGLRMGAERELRITALLERLNRVIARSTLSTRFVSLFYGDLETNGNLFYVNAGHPAPWIYGERGMRRLSIGGTILGPLRDASFKRGFAHVDRGDTMVLLTDGVLERVNRKGVMFDEHSVEAVVRDCHGRPAEEILDELFRRSGHYGGGRPWTDDTTAIVITRHPTKKT